MVLRCSLQHPEIEIVGINDLCPADYLAYMLKYDTMHGRINAQVSSGDNSIIVDGHVIPVYAERDPANLPWKEIGAEYVIESTGLFLTKDKAKGHIEAGAKHVVMSAPSKDDTPMFVMGVNQDSYTSDMTFVSNASCTTNCLAPIAKVLHDNFVSVVDLTVNLEKPASYDEICDAMKKAAQGQLKGILDYTDEPVVSSDFLGNTHTSIFDAKAGIALTDTFVKVVSWYDNEIGYSDKILCLIEHMYSVDHK